LPVLRPEQARRRLLAGFDQGIERRPNNAGLGFLGVADGAGFVDFFSRQLNIGNGRNILCGNIPFALASMALDLPPILQGYRI
jgi:hypothetical protein